MISQGPAAGTEVAEGSASDIVVSLGPGNHAPVALNDANPSPENFVVTVTPPGVLGPLRKVMGRGATRDVHLARDIEGDAKCVLPTDSTQERGEHQRRVDYQRQADIV